MDTTEKKRYPIAIENYPIRLGQFMKRAAIVSDGAEAKQLISDGCVMVNDLPEYRRGRQLVSGDAVSVGNNIYLCL